MRARLALVAVLAAITVGAGAAPAVGGAYPGRNGLIAFTFEPAGGVSGISTIDPVTKAVVHLTNADDSQPVWSPDGRHIAFTRIVDGDNEIFMMNADGSGQTALTNNDGNSCPTWSPDGKRVAFSDGNGNIGIVTVANPTVVTTLAVPNTCELSWSASNVIAFSTAGGIDTVAPDGTNLQVVTTDATDETPNWSPDGTRLLFSRDLPDTSTEVFIKVINQPTPPSAVPNTGPRGVGPAWSPDGATLVFANCPVLCDLVLINPDGTGAQTLLSEQPIRSQPDWQPLASPAPPPPPNVVTPAAAAVPLRLIPTFTG